MKTMAFISGAALLLLALGKAEAAPICGDIYSKMRETFDYRDPNPNWITLVEGAHFTEDVEQGIRGSSGTLAGPDLQYTLEHFPNHRRALDTLIRLAPRTKSGMIAGMKWPIECYFERAVRFRPDDGLVWALYAKYQYVMGREAQAFPMLEKALVLSPDDPAINYNVGLAYAKQKKFAQALPYAQKAYAAGFPLPGLKQMLINARAWVEPPKPEPAQEAAETPAAPAAPATSAAAPSAVPAPTQ
jgi:tetratricopeptide (TPR) repeat protein